MSGLIGSLQNSSGALRVHSKGLEVAGKNLANINNRGYSKERVAIGDRGSIDTGIATESMGVEAMGLRQNRDALLDKSVMREITSTGSLEAAKKVLESAETALGQFLDRTKDSTSIQNASGASGGGISDALTDFFNAWESFSVKPNDVGEKQLLIAKAQILAEKINSTDKRLNQVQLDVDAQSTTDVGIVNGLLAEIAKTNEYIAKAELVKPFSAVDLRDQRQAKLEELAQYIDVNFEPDTLGQIIVKSGNNELIKGKVVTGQTIDPATGVITGPFSYNSTDRKIKLATADFTGSGKLSGQLNAAVEDVKAAREQIKDLADQLTTSVNLVYEGVESTKPQFFKKTPSNGLLIEFSGITASALRASNTSGGNRMALDIASLANKPFSTIGNPPDLITGTYSSFFNKTVTTLAQELNTTNIRLEDQKLSQEMALNNRDQYSGVSQDEEITDMMKFQRSFQASARHMNVIDTLLEQVVNRLGVG